MDSFILAIDLGKFNSVFCWYDPVTRAATYLTVPSRPAAFRDRIASRPVVRVVIEAGALCGWVHDLCEELGVPCDVANTNAAAWQWKHVKRKTDKDDAVKLARLASLDELPTVAVPPSAWRQWKSLIGLRKRLVGERVRLQNRIRGVLCGQGLPAPVGRRAWTRLGRVGIAQEARPLAGCGPLDLWRGELHVLLGRLAESEAAIRTVEAKLDDVAAANDAVQRLTTIPGVGGRTAEVVVTHLLDATRFASADQVSAYAGLVPRQFQSGQTDRRGAVTKRGPRLLRAALVEGAWCCVRYNPDARVLWQRHVDRGLSRKKAIVVLARKLLVWCWAMLRRGTAWRGSGPVVAAGPLAGRTPRGDDPPRSRRRRRTTTEPNDAPGGVGR